jgi:hypothetical protein
MRLLRALPQRRVTHGLDVIARKVSHGSKNDRGAYTFATFTSVVRALAKHRADVLVEGLYHLFQIPSLQYKS